MSTHTIPKLLVATLLGCARSTSGTYSITTEGDAAGAEPDGSASHLRPASLNVGAQLMGGRVGAHASVEFRALPRANDGRCTRMGADNWDVIACDDGRPPPGDTHPLPFPHAGVITLRGGSEVISLTPGDDGRYPPFLEPRAVFRGPQRVDVGAQGSALATPFSITVEVPSPLALVSPAIVPGAPIVFARDQDIALTWRPSDAQSLYVFVNAWGTVGSSQRSVRVIARFPGATGAGVIPQRATRELSSFTLLKGMNFSASPQNITSHDVEGWSVVATTSGLGVSADAELR